MARVNSNNPGKRKAVDAETTDALTREVTKRPRVSLPSKQHFLQCHLRVLQCLYAAPPDNNEGGEDFTDGRVSKEVWEMIQKFIDERDGLEGKQRKAENDQRIYEEALTFIADYPAKDPEARLPVAVSRALASPIPRSPAFKGEHESEPVDSLQFVARLLKKKSKTAKKVSMRVVEPYLALAAAVRERIEKLRMVIDTFKRSRAEEERRRLETMAPVRLSTGTIVELRTKERLWGILSENLENITLQ